MESLTQCLAKWKPIDGEHNDSLKAFNHCFEVIIPSMLPETDNTTFTRNVSPLEAGKPNLVVTARNKTHFATLKV